MEQRQQFILVAASNKTGEAFIRKLMLQKLPFAALVNSKSEAARLEEIGVKHFILVDTTEERTWVMPELPVGKVYLFESSLNLCCRYIRVCHMWTSEPIYVITHSVNPRLIYRALGASFVIHTNSHDVSFLLASQRPE